MTRENGHVGIVPIETATADSGLAFLEKLRNGALPSPPYAAWANIWIVEVEHGRVMFEARPSEQFYNPLGTVHGGWTSGLLDSAMGCAVHSTLQVGQAYTTVDLSITLVRPVLVQSGTLYCEGNVIHAGGRIATAEGRVRDRDGKLIAHGSETCMILNRTDKTISK